MRMRSEILQPSGCMRELCINGNGNFGRGDLLPQSLTTIQTNAHKERMNRFKLNLVRAIDIGHTILLTFVINPFSFKIWKLPCINMEKLMDTLEQEA